MANAKSSLLAGALLLAAPLLGPAPLATAQQLVSTGASFVETRLLAGAPMAEGVRVVGIELTVAPGWKTYWRTPGEAGVPPRFDWTASGNLAETEVLFPVPERFDSFGYETLGYSDRVVLPIRLVAENPEAPIDLSLRLDLGVCAEICVFETVEIERTLEPEAADGAADVALALAAVPPDGAEAGVEHALCRIEGSGVDRQLTATIRLAEPRPVPIVVVEAAGEAWAHGVTSRAVGREVEVEAVVSLATPESWLSRADLRFTLLGEDGYAADISGCDAQSG